MTNTLILSIVLIFQIITVITSLIFMLKGCKYSPRHIPFIIIASFIFIGFPIVNILVSFGIQFLLKKYYIINTSTKKLGLCDLNNEIVEGYIDSIKSIKSIPNELSLWNTLRGGYEMVSQDKGVSSEQKQKLKKLLQSMGVSGLK